MLPNKSLRIQCPLVISHSRPLGMAHARGTADAGHMGFDWQDSNKVTMGVQSTVDFIELPLLVLTAKLRQLAMLKTSRGLGTNIFFLGNDIQYPLN